VGISINPVPPQLEALLKGLSQQKAAVTKAVWDRRKKEKICRTLKRGHPEAMNLKIFPPDVAFCHDCNRYLG
jgi:hypothetical protein